MHPQYYMYLYGPRQPDMYARQNPKDDTSLAMTSTWACL